MPFSASAFAGAAGSRHLLHLAVRVAYTDAELPPYVLGEGSVFHEPPGLFTVWARAALQKLGCMAVVSETRLPYNRIVSSMAAGTIDIRVTGGYRSEVADIMHFPMRNGGTNRAMAVAEANTRLYVLKNAPAPAPAPALAWDGTHLHFTGPHPAIGTVRGHYTEKLIQTYKLTRPRTGTPMSKSCSPEESQRLSDRIRSLTRCRNADRCRCLSSKFHRLWAMLGT